MIFDGHNDALSRLWCSGDDPVDGFQNGTGHVTVENARKGGFCGGFFALYAPKARAPFDFSAFASGLTEMPLPPMLEQAQALASIVAQVGVARRLEEAGQLQFSTTGAGLRETVKASGIAALLHLEGADCIDTDLHVLEALFAQGLRSIGPVWSRPTIFGAGVPFALGKDADTGPGLTDAGWRLVRRCAELGMVVDTSHITMQGFWDIAEAGLPLVATHSNAFAVCPVTRNLTDRQLQAIAETGGMVGLNFGTIFLSEEGWNTGNAGFPDMIRHLDHMLEVAGEDHVGLGSDFDGVPLPKGVDSTADLPALVGAMQNHGYGSELIAKITHENWLAFLEKRLG